MPQMLNCESRPPAARRSMRIWVIIGLINGVLVFAYFILHVDVLVAFALVDFPFTELIASGYNQLGIPWENEVSIISGAVVSTVFWWYVQRPRHRDKSRIE